MNGAFDKIAAIGVVPVIAIENVAHAEPLADALLEGGLGVAEITFRTAVAADVMARLRDTRPELLVGAGTVLSARAVSDAVDAGAAFGLAPGHDPAVLDAADAAGLPFAPGIMTPSDVSLATARGCRLMKFFPATAAGGPSMLKNIAAPFAHLDPAFIPTGGVTLDTMADWLALPAVSAVGGTWIAKPEDMRNGDWKAIARRARAAVDRVRETGR
ncbi:MAG: bifunctional 4-hydroxy-2-oxoglutarate aldolase/2-dehydro-3-deoxy-phosphogluconate aldolase [Roseitalea sp.]|jgi:2-dehydro-3-deoxyphosphogluconate aldolase/(4S)-4-hydroxy-2-oxoglutarate aldolase|nr:bifunctional 4-hydroxy-2-oxoglutarate aldolase/2-dehydro-3-deoxy-phosphogluconate aldolase [Roseitalea sp.]MBO6720439.1 bifunctional 4-hydroxy-2-oxoglutarate aldolase/2-dehydro-3-deoxy-phosphogluconate aldolase [Roseitalea sp.]MBO6742799.1 bifunctional 4-hydroxy-2-oxoglutarate aldolase/2-dehydro-3-deoxy-phosphogluconate aldolase [Roseitalea sp.]